MKRCQYVEMTERNFPHVNPQVCAQFILSVFHLPAPARYTVLSGGIGSELIITSLKYFFPSASMVYYCFRILFRVLFLFHDTQYSKQSTHIYNIRCAPQYANLISFICIQSLVGLLFIELLLLCIVNYPSFIICHSSRNRHRDYITLQKYQCHGNIVIVIIVWRACGGLHKKR